MKAFALMGVGKIFLTDDDIIEPTNLSRQFLFSSQDRGASKSDVVATKISQINPRCRVLAHKIKVGSEEGNRIFSERFYIEDIDGITTALDNREARNYLADKAFLYHLSFLDSGTLGTNAHVTQMIPYVTGRYHFEKTESEVMGICTLRYFPTSNIHTTFWALDRFNEIFSTKGSLASIDISPITPEACIWTALLLFDSLFVVPINETLKLYPGDAIDPLTKCELM